MMDRTQFSPHKTVRTDVETIYTHLTQPTGLGGGLGWYELYQACHLRPGGIPSGHLRLTGREPGGDAPHKEVDMNTTSSSLPLDVVVSAIAVVRREWELEAGNESLISIRASVGLLLADIVIGLGLKQEEQQAALGSELFGELEIAGVLTAEHDAPALSDASDEWVPEVWVLAEQ